MKLWIKALEDHPLIEAEMGCVSKESKGQGSEEATAFGGLDFFRIKWRDFRVRGCNWVGFFVWSNNVL